MDGKQFLGTARFLRNSGSDEAAYRSAVSRAYYACFLVARQVAFDNCSPSVRCKADIGTVRKIGHEQLRRYLKNSSDGETQRLGQDLAGLQGSRQDADYDMEGTLAAEDAQNSIDEAEAFLNSLSQLPPAQIGRAMEEYIHQTFSE